MNICKEKEIKVKESSIYTHSFCSQICLYCGFFQNYSNEERETMYVDRLIKQLLMAKEYKYVQDSVINAVFLVVEHHLHYRHIMQIDY